MKVCFTETVTTKSAEPRTFKKGEVHDFPEDVANRWLRRNKAVEAPDDEPQPRPRPVVYKAPPAPVSEHVGEAAMQSTSAMKSEPPAKVGPSVMHATASASSAPKPVPKAQ